MTKKIDIHSNHETTCIADYFIPRKNGKILNYEDACKFSEGTFKTKIGGTVYEVSTHFNPKGTQSVMEQFKKLILFENLI